MPEKIIMPRMGMTMETGFVTKWYKKEGEPVKAGEPIVEIMTDKANMDVEAESDGIVYKILAKEGEEIPVGNVIGIIKNKNDTDEKLEEVLKELSQTSQSAKTSRASSLKKRSQAKTLTEELAGNYKPATPFAKKLAKKYGIDPKKIGASGILTSEKILREAGSSDILLRAVRKAMAQKMTESARIPQFTLYYNFRISNMLRHFKTFKSKLPEVTLTVFIVKALSYAMNEFPVFNSVYENNALRTNEHMNIGVAVATESGLFVPVLKRVESKSVPELSEELALLKKKAFDGKLGNEELSGASITVSNMGMFGVDMFRALLVPGQSAILAVSAAKETVIVRNGGIFVEKVMNVSISCDHRFVDGATAARFMNELKAVTEEKYKEILKWE